MLRIYRRHRSSCSHTSERYRRCSCPIYVEGTLGGETIRRAVDQTNWEAASELVAKWTASGQIGVARLDIPDIKDAVDKYFEDAKARQLQPGTISKHTNLLKNRLLPWCDDKRRVDREEPCDGDQAAEAPRQVEEGQGVHQGSARRDHQSLRRVPAAEGGKTLVGGRR